MHAVSSDEALCSAVVFPRWEVSFSSGQPIGEPLLGCIDNIGTYLGRFLIELGIEFDVVCNLLHCFIDYSIVWLLWYDSLAHKLLLHIYWSGFSATTSLGYRLFTKCEFFLEHVKLYRNWLWNVRGKNKSHLLENYLLCNCLRLLRTGHVAIGRVRVPSMCEAWGPQHLCLPSRSFKTALHLG